MRELLKMRFFCLSSLDIPFPKWNFMSHCKKKRPSREVQSGNWGNGPLPHAQSTRMSLLDALSVVTLCKETRVSLKTRAVRRNLAAGRSWKLAPLWSTRGSQRTENGTAGRHSWGHRGSSEGRKHSPGLGTLFSPRFLATDEQAGKAVTIKGPCLSAHTS